MRELDGFDEYFLGREGMEVLFERCNGVNEMVEMRIGIFSVIHELMNTFFDIGNIIILFLFV
jgi:hypothetical protein